MAELEDVQIVGTPAALSHSMLKCACSNNLAGAEEAKLIATRTQQAPGGRADGE